MGRHASAQSRPARAAGNPELLGWAAFMAPMCVVALGLAGVGWLVAVGVGALVAGALVVVWVASALAPPTARSPQRPASGPDQPPSVPDRADP